MDLESPLKRGITQCRHEAKRWLAMVVFTLATLVIAICINAMWPSLELQQTVNLLAAASVMAIICSLFGVKQCLNSNESIQYGLSAFRDLRRSLEDVESEKADLREALQQFRSSYLMLLLDFESVVCDKAKLQKELDATKQRLEDTRDELVSAGYAIESIRNGFCQAKKNAKALQDELDATKLELQQVQERLYETEDELEKTRGWLDETENELYKSWDDLDSVKSELREAKLELRRTGEDAKFNELCYESLRKTYSETTLDLLKTRRERDGLQSKLVAVRRFARRLLAERNKLQHELTEAKIGFEWFLSLYYEAEERIRFAKQQIERLEQQIEHLETVNKLLAKFATDDV